MSQNVSNLTEFIRIVVSNPILDRPNGTKLDKQDEKRQLRQMTEQQQQEQEEELSDV